VYVACVKKKVESNLFFLLIEPKPKCVRLCPALPYLRCTDDNQFYFETKQVEMKGI